MSPTNAEFSAWLLNSMRCALVAIDEEGVVMAFNDDAQRLLELSESTAPTIGRPAQQVLADQPGLYRLLREGLAGSESPARSEFVLEPSSNTGRARTIGYTLCAVREAGSRVRGAAILFRDLAPIERCDERERLRARLAALGEMAAGLAHEIRNPLAGMQVSAGLLQRSFAHDPDALGLVDGIQREIQCIAQVVERTVDFVRSAEPARVEIDLREVVEVSLERALARIAFKGVVERSYEEALPSLPGDAAQLESALGSLLVNSLQAMAEAPQPQRQRAQRLRIGIGLEQLDGRIEVVISVEDSGPGIDADLRERVFYPFFTTKETGLGIGLATAQKIVAGHGGFLTLDSSPAGGALFRVHLPVSDSEAVE